MGEGKGVGVVSPPAALLHALQRAPAGPAGSVRHVLAQQFVENQLLIDGRPFYIRWDVGGGGGDWSCHRRWKRPAPSRAHQPACSIPCAAESGHRPWCGPQAA